MNRPALSRRDVLALAAGSAASLAVLRAQPAPAAPMPERSTIDGVKIGAQTYSFHDIPNDGGNHADRVIADMRECGLFTCELWPGHIEASTYVGIPPPAADCPKPDIGCAPGKGGSERNGFAWVFGQRQGEDLIRTRQAIRAFLESGPTKYFEDIRRRFADAGIEIYTYNAFMDPGAATPQMPTTDAEIDGIFYAAKALGVKAINASITKTVLRRLIPFAEKHRVIIAPHGHSETSNPEHFSTRRTFTDAFTLSKWVGANLDIGHYTAAGGDPLEFINSFAERITNLHLKDRRRNRSRTIEDGANMPWGQGETPIGEVLRLIRDKRYNIPCMIEIEHIGTTSATGEVKIAYEYCKRELAKA
ncbi:MAG TPA: sugar phosphate isomerase/epimerase [Steroidobacteraceae bacterium]|nr:sugar phosphate isomerase/epimerase [Steroidobacteraceae bacterium]